MTLCAFFFEHRRLRVVGREHRVPSDGEVVAIPGNLRKLPDRVRVKPAVSCLRKKSLQRIFGWQRAAVRTLGGERIVDIRNLQNPCFQRNVLSAQVVRISAAVHFFMVMTNYGKNAAERLQRFANTFACDGMLLNNFSFLRVEWPGF